MLEQDNEGVGINTFFALPVWHLEDWLEKQGAILVGHTEVASQLEKGVPGTGSVPPSQPLAGGQDSPGQNMPYDRLVRRRQSPPLHNGGWYRPGRGPLDHWGCWQCQQCRVWWRTTGWRRVIMGRSEWSRG